jgi:hypothetical protein
MHIWLNCNAAAATNPTHLQSGWQWPLLLASAAATDGSRQQQNTSGTSVNGRDLLQETVAVIQENFMLMHKSPRGLAAFPAHSRCYKHP